MNGIYRTIKISAIRQEGENFKTFEFEEGHGIRYKAGQYITLVKQINDEEARRSYSMVSSPTLNEPLAIGVKRLQNGLFSRLLIDKAKPGDEWLCTGAGGFFTLPEDIKNYRQIFFFAAGTGITPILSLVKTVLHNYPEITVHLIYSNSSIYKAVYVRDLEDLQTRYANRFNLEWLFSDSAALEKARLHRDLLLQLTQDLSLAEPGETLYFICGPESYMRMCTYTLQENDVPHQNIRKENFNVQKIKGNKHLPPDKKSHDVKIFFGDESFVITVPYPDNILKAAKSQGYILPYSCEVGRCGNCAAKCISGKIWHSYNEVLTEKELSNGLILTCVGHPVGGDAVVRIG